MSTAGVELRRVSFGFGPRTVLHDVTVSIVAGSRLAVVGPNGVGKSTLLRLIAGQEQPETGAVRPVGSLSPGERTRADLALLMAVGANVLVLDEPTNHLDLAAIESLEQALEAFDGTFLLVSHDRRLLERVRIDRRLRVDGGQVREV